MAATVYLQISALLTQKREVYKGFKPTFTVKSDLNLPYTFIWFNQNQLLKSKLLFDTNFQFETCFFSWILAHGFRLSFLKNSSGFSSIRRQLLWKRITGASKRLAFATRSIWGSSSAHLQFFSQPWREWNRYSRSLSVTLSDWASRRHQTHTRFFSSRSLSLPRIPPLSRARPQREALLPLSLLWLNPCLKTPMAPPHFKEVLTTEQRCSSAERWRVWGRRTFDPQKKGELTGHQFKRISNITNLI